MKFQKGDIIIGYGHDVGFIIEVNKSENCYIILWSEYTTPLNHHWVEDAYEIMSSILRGAF